MRDTDSLVENVKVQNNGSYTQINKNVLVLLVSLSRDYA